MSDDQFLSGPWTGYYTYTGHAGRYRTDLGMEFGDGIVTGEGTDDVGPFVIRGRFDHKSKECHWTKTYVAAHDVFYQGVRQGKGIWGTWEIPGETKGGFKIWPLGSGSGDEDAEAEEKVEPVKTVSALAAGAR